MDYYGEVSVVPQRPRKVRPLGKDAGLWRKH